MTTVTFFTKPDCTLCRGALFVIERVRRRLPFELEVCDISAVGNERWHEAYKHDIPVVHIDGQEVFRHRVDEGLFLTLVDAAATDASSDGCGDV